MPLDSKKSLFGNKHLVHSPPHRFVVTVPWSTSIMSYPETYIPFIVHLFPIHYVTWSISSVVQIIHVDTVFYYSSHHLYNRQFGWQSYSWIPLAFPPKFIGTASLYLDSKYCGDARGQVEFFFKFWFCIFAPRSLSEELFMRKFKILTKISTCLLGSCYF